MDKKALKEIIEIIEGGNKVIEALQQENAQLREALKEVHNDLCCARSVEIEEVVTEIINRVGQLLKEGETL